jgi:hypothetical protein
MKFLHKFTHDLNRLQTKNHKKISLYAKVMPKIDLNRLQTKNHKKISLYAKVMPKILLF